MDGPARSLCRGALLLMASRRYRDAPIRTNGVAGRRHAPGTNHVDHSGRRRGKRDRGRGQLLGERCPSSLSSPLLASTGAGAWSTRPSATQVERCQRRARASRPCPPRSARAGPWLAWRGTCIGRAWARCPTVALSLSWPPLSQIAWKGRPGVPPLRRTRLGLRDSSSSFPDLWMRAAKGREPSRCRSESWSRSRRVRVSRGSSGGAGGCRTPRCTRTPRTAARGGTAKCGG